MLELIKSLVIEIAKSTDEVKYSCTKRFSIIHYYNNNNYRRKLRAGKFCVLSNHEERRSVQQLSAADCKQR